MSLIVDEFLSNFQGLRDYSMSAVFDDIVSPFDGVTYPLICSEIPEEFTGAIYARLSEFLGRDPISPTIFLRLSTYGTPVPHQVHSDTIMGGYTLLLYLNEEAACVGGTSFLSHNATGMAYAPQDPEFIQILEMDQNNGSAWTVREMAIMKPNRGVIFDAAKIHRSEPVGGFGTTQQDGRLVLTCFFS